MNKVYQEIDIKKKIRRISYRVASGDKRQFICAITDGVKPTVVNLKLDHKAKTNFYLVTVGDRLIDFTLNINLLGNNSSAEVFLISLSKGPVRHNLSINLWHQGIETFGRINCRRLAFGHSINSCNSKIIISQSAIGADSYLSDRSIFMDVAKIISSPMLEIENNNVKASHAAATGQISELELFYLQARGFTESAAKVLILQSFIREILPIDIYTNYNLQKKIEAYVTRNRN